MASQEIPTLESQPREHLGTRYSARLRKEGRLPAVVYGHKQENVAISLDYRELVDLLHENAHLIKITLDGGKTEPCLIKEVQWDHLGRQIIHIDLARVDLSEEVEVEVELTITGENKALDQSGVVLTHPATTIEVACRADGIPETIAVDISELEVGGTITVADLKLPAGVRAVSDPDTVLAQIEEVAAAAEEEAEEAGAAEPEVIGRAAAEEEEAE